ncbi:hypothetical protein D3C79_878330 [compost metagenome]
MVQVAIIIDRADFMQEHMAKLMNERKRLQCFEILLFDKNKRAIFVIQRKTKNGIVFGYLPLPMVTIAAKN